MPELPEVTVAIPLHESSEWRENVLGNVERLAGTAKLIVSDPTDEDGTLRWLEQEAGPLSNVIFAGRRKGADGLARHFNDLLGLINTPLGMVLPHDDEVGVDWVREAQEELSRNPDAILAVGRMEGIAGPGNLFVGQIHELDPRLEDPADDARVQATGEFMICAQHKLGLAFRGVFRTARAWPMPERIVNDEWADLFWACGMAARGRFVPLPSATYRKRFRPGATHLRWTPFSPESAAEEIQEYVVQSMPVERREQASMAMWRGTHNAIAASRSDFVAAHAHAGNALLREQEEVVMLRTQLSERENALNACEESIRQADEAAAEADRRLAIVYRSRSWRWSAPLRHAAALIRRLRQQAHGA